jgi:GntR family transcriptional regulator
MLVVNLDPRDPRPLYLQIVDEVRRALALGTLQADDPVPSVRDLASQLVINPRTVMQAYQELEAEGVLEVRRGQGTFVASGFRPDRPGRARELATRVLDEARRNGIGADELITSIRKIAAEHDDAPVVPAATARHGVKK